MSKFKVGDKVKIRSWDSLTKEFGVDDRGGIIIPGNPWFAPKMKKYCGRTLTIKEISFSGNYKTEEAHDDNFYWWFGNSMIENINPSTIIIYSEDNKVIALDKGTGKKAEAICNPQDEFDFYFGADLAFERLMNGNTPKEKKPEIKYYTGEIFCIKSNGPLFTKGKIYKVKDGVLCDDVSPWSIKFSSFEQITKVIRQSEFIEVKK